VERPSTPALRGRGFGAASHGDAPGAAREEPERWVGFAQGPIERDRTAVRAVVAEMRDEQLLAPQGESEYLKI
jgi:hypothetical protein